MLSLQTPIPTRKPSLFFVLRSSSSVTKYKFGYDPDFTDAIAKDWGGRPFEDLRKGWKHILDKYPEVSASFFSISCFLAFFILFLLVWLLWSGYFARFGSSSICLLFAFLEF